MLSYQKGNKIFFINGSVPLTPEEEAQLLVDVNYNDTDIYVNGVGIRNGGGVADAPASPDLTQLKSDVADLKQKVDNLKPGEGGGVIDYSVVDTKIASHNLDPQSHNDIRNSLKAVEDEVALKADASQVNNNLARIETAEENINALQNDVAVFISTSKDAALKSGNNTFTGNNSFGDMALQGNVSLTGNARLVDAKTGNTILTTITKDSNTQQLYLGLHDVWVKGPDQILLESDNIKTKRSDGNNNWTEYVNIDSGNIQDYLPSSGNSSAGITQEELNNTLKDYVRTDQTLELIENYINVDNLAKEVLIDAPETATSGTLTVEQLTTLQAGDANFLMFNNEKYYLNDKGHVAGYLTYSHTGYENNTPIIKTITITINTRGWVLNTAELNNAVIKYVTINAPSTAMEGTFSAEDLVILQSSKSNKIIFDNEIYNLQDTQHETGYIIYSHVGHNNYGEFMIKCITVTLSTGGWVLCEIDVQKQHCYNVVGVTNDNLNVGAIVYSYIDSDSLDDVLEGVGRNIAIPCSVVVSSDVVSDYIVTGMVYTGNGVVKINTFSVSNTTYSQQTLKSANIIQLY